MLSFPLAILLLVLHAQAQVNDLVGPDKYGNKVPDFSNCGYQGGGVAIPDIPVKETLKPCAKNCGDDGARIQAALDKVGGLPPTKITLSNGHAVEVRGAVLLEAGVYRVGGSIQIPKSGVVLRGVGPQEQNGTTIIATGTSQRNFIIFKGGDKDKETGAQSKILGDFVPTGVKSFQIAGGETYAPGDKIHVVRPGTDAWIQAIGMARCAPTLTLHSLS